MYTYNYPRAALTTDAIVFVNEEKILSLSVDNNKDGISRETYVLLIQRGREPFKNFWALPGGFIEMEETLANACKRELKEETGLMVDEMTQFKTYDAIGRDPRYRTISVVYSVEIDEKQAVAGSDDASDAKWFSIKELPDLAFDHQIILKDFFS